MEAILVTPETKSQSSLIKELLREMRIRFTTYTEEEEIEVSTAEMEAIQKGLEDVANGRVVSDKEANKYFQDVLNRVD